MLCKCGFNSLRMMNNKTAYIPSRNSVAMLLFYQSEVYAHFGFGKISSMATMIVKVRIRF